MNIFVIRFPPLLVEAETPQQAANIAVQRLLEGKTGVTVGTQTRTVFDRKTNTGPATPLTWWPMGKMAQIMCPIGHTVTLLSEIHTIRDNGEVTPSVICGVDGCPFHTFIQLDGWTP